MSPAVSADVEQNCSFHKTKNFGPLATSSSLDEQIMMREHLCTDSCKHLTTRTESSSTNDGNKEEKTRWYCGEEKTSQASLKYNIQLQHLSPTTIKKKIQTSDENTMGPLLGPFGYGVEELKTQNDLREHLGKEHSYTDSLKHLTTVTENSSANRKDHVPHLGKAGDNLCDETVPEENNEIRKTYLCNTQGLTLYKFRKLIKDNHLHEVPIWGNRYCFLLCIIMTLAEHDINKTLEVLSMEVMVHIRQNRDDFYSRFKSFSKLEEKLRT